ncbi:hypothetical protein INH39_08640 [Massilia violaceinigra]|uniref:Lipoprotein n=1 Tax=Massilia violaceinigra TaxID=2045208 RepID=A0ABY4ABH9_9BURK|nr:hypothetical protein [Massilia violaceinigra]UOD31732.1 hypothetical protein INH39_08640 [Massilia violaceinigra]
MTCSVLRHSLLLTLALGLAACGGKATFPVEGKVVNLKYPGLVLSNIGMSDLPVDAKATSYRFPNTIEYGVQYDVQVKSTALHQDCTPDNNKDTAGRQASISATITCRDFTYQIGGAVKIVGADGQAKPYVGENLVLINGSSDRINVAKDAQSYKFGSAIAFGVSYGVSVLQQPDGGKLVCSVDRGIGEMGDAEVTNVNVLCREK